MVDEAVSEHPRKFGARRVDLRRRHEDHLDIGAAFSLPPGRYVLICNLQNHYRLGRHVVVTVTG